MRLFQIKITLLITFSFNTIASESHFFFDTQKIMESTDEKVCDYFVAKRDYVTKNIEYVSADIFFENTDFDSRDIELAEVSPLYTQSDFFFLRSLVKSKLQHAEKIGSSSRIELPRWYPGAFTNQFVNDHLNTHAKELLLAVSYFKRDRIDVCSKLELNSQELLASIAAEFYQSNWITPAGHDDHHTKITLVEKFSAVISLSESRTKKIPSAGRIFRYTDSGDVYIYTIYADSIDDVKLSLKTNFYYLRKRSKNRIYLE